MVSAVVIRRATTEDARGIAEVHVRGWQIGYADIVAPEYLATFDVDEREIRWREHTLRDATLDILVAEQEGMILGFTTFSANGDGLGKSGGEITGLYVDPAAWQLGIGSRLLQAAIDGLMAADYTRAILWTLEANARTRGFYERRGWKLDGATRPHRSGATLVRYWLSLPTESNA